MLNSVLPRAECDAFLMCDASRDLLQQQCILLNGFDRAIFNPYDGSVQRFATGSIGGY
jgi:hypothetical protein